jgi:hypothetical protein
MDMPPKQADFERILKKFPGRFNSLEEIGREYIRFEDGLIRKIKKKK